MRILAALLALACAAAGSYGRAADVRDTTRSPVLVELFTSEGCSSCPPVDARLQQLDAAQPFPNAQLIVLSEHVDYWNHDGWKDPYSSSFFTARQDAYVRALGLKEPYTPQVIIDGVALLRSYNPQQIGRMIETAAATPQIAVHIASLRVEDSTPPVLRTRVEATGNSAGDKADVYLAITLDHAESQVSAGENSGQRLSHVAVVQSLKKLGKFESDEPFAQDCQIKLKKGDDPGNIRVVAFVQEPGPGKVLGAALRKPQAKASTAP